MGCPKLYEDWRFVSAETAKAPACPFRFSSEYLDSETNLVYYNYRYYSPELGRWLKRTA
jgi:RHS repeat-associated protein